MCLKLIFTYWAQVSDHFIAIKLIKKYDIFKIRVFIWTRFISLKESVSILAYFLVQKSIKILNSHTRNLTYSGLRNYEDYLIFDRLNNCTQKSSFHVTVILGSQSSVETRAFIEFRIKLIEQ